LIRVLNRRWFERAVKTGFTFDVMPERAVMPELFGKFDGYIFELATVKRDTLLPYLSHLKMSTRKNSFLHLIPPRWA